MMRKPCACIELHRVSPRVQSYTVSLFDYVIKTVSLSLSCPHKTDDGFSLSLFLTLCISLSLSLTHSLSLPHSLSLACSIILSRILALLLSCSLVLLLSRFHLSCLHNQHGTGGSCRLVRASIREMAATTAHMLGACRHTIGDRFLICGLAILKAGSV